MSGITRGQRVGRYELVQVLGEGGMGMVWLAHPYDAPEQLFAVKMVSSQYSSDARVCTMFVKEAQLAAAIDHPNVVRLYDVGLHEDVPFFVMEWIDGWSLREIVRTIVDTGEFMPPQIALRIASDLCAGLHAAHELCDDAGRPLGLVHRDVSPHNVLISRDGMAKLIDFGVAKARDLVSGNDISVCAGLKGKVRYMAPEQALDKTIDRRADLFSVGAIVYQLLTGRAPFEGPNELAIINALLSTNPVYVPDTLPEPVQWILRRALSRRPEQRFEDAAEMQNAIELALVELGQADTHEAVADCLAWISGEVEEPTTALAQKTEQGPEAHEEEAAEDETTAERRATFDSQFVRESLPPPAPPAANAASPPLAFAMPSAETVPARQSSLVDEDPPPMAHIPAAAAATASSFRFILLGAGFVGLLGIGAAMLVRDGPPSGHRAAARETTAQFDPPSPADPAPGATESVPTGGLSPNTPIIELGDLDDPAKRSASPRPRRRWPVSASTGVSSPPPPPPPPANANKAGGDLAGPIKVWK